MMFDENPDVVASVVGGSGGKPGRCFASVTGPQADDTRARAIALRPTRSTIAALWTPKDRQQGAHSSAARRGGFTLAELLVSVGVLVLLVFFVSQLLNTAANVTTLGHKQMDAESQTRQLFDRMAIDFDQMVKRSDIDYYVKSSWFASGSPPGPAGLRTLVQLGNDQIAFYCGVPGYGYFPTPTVESPLSIVAYRINQDASPGNPAYLRLERMGRGLLWNAAPPPPPPIMATPTPSATPFSGAPAIFMPVPLASPLPTLEMPVPAATPACQWAASSTASWGSESEIIGPQVFRFEYYYLLKSQTNPAAPSPTPTPYTSILTDTPWDTRICSCPPNPTTTPVPPGPTPTPTPIATPTPPVICCHVSPQGMQDVAAIVVVIAVIDPKSRALLDNAAQVPPPNDNITRLGAQLIDWGASCPGCQWQTTPGLLATKWRTAIDANIYPNGLSLPAPALSGIRVYERYFYLRPPTLLTP